MDDLKQKGVAVVDALLGAGFGEKLLALSSEEGAFGAPLADMGLTFAFGTAWGRSGMEGRLRSIAVISSLITQRQMSELKMHVRIGINNGLTPADLEDILVILTPYLGFPAVSTAQKTIVEVLRERGFDTGQTAEERGLKY
jgi:4-carboxymuconolactone decarboxylase